MTMGRRKQQVLYVVAALLALVVMLAACSTGSNAVTPDELPPGDAARGAALFSRSINGAPPCSACHSERSSTMGPTLVSYSVALQGRDASETYQYTLDAIIRPAKDIPPGYSNSMYQAYGNKLSPQELADLIAYMLD